MTSSTPSSPLRRWFSSLRPYSVIPSLIPPLAAVGIARSMEPEVLRWAFPVYLAATVLLHFGANVLNDYYDYRHGVDHEGTVDTDHVLVAGVVTPRFMLLSGHLYFVSAVLLGLLIGAVRGPAFVLVGLCAVAAAYFYTGGRFSFKYVAVGELVVFLLAGPGLIGLAVWVLAGAVPPVVIPVSLPIASLAAAILHGNNMRDRRTDRAAGVRTLANSLSQLHALGVLALLLLLPYPALVIMIVSGVAHFLTAFAVLSLPAALRILRRTAQARDERELRLLPRSCALLYGAFSLPYAAAILLTGVRL